MNGIRTIGPPKPVDLAPEIIHHNARIPMPHREPGNRQWFGS